MASTILEVRGLKKSFEVKNGIFGKKKYLHAVNGLNFSVYEGETFSLVGESGCGKSTAGRLISRLIDPTAGEIWIDGEEISKWKESQLQAIRKKVQMVFQDPYASLNPRMKIRDIIAEPLVIHTKLTKKEKQRLVSEMLEVVGLNEYQGNCYAHEFSGGQRQRIGIGRALIMKPKLIIADEPVSALDVSVQSQILNLLKDLQEEFNLTYVFISHDLSVVEHISDHIGVMYLGSIVEYGPKEQIFTNPLHPYTKALLSSVPIPDPTVKREKIILKGDIPNPVNPPSGCKFHTRCPDVMEICKGKDPSLKQIHTDNHLAACHLYEKTIKNQSVIV
ncbi:peptide/nickel transport system ATP-binding protein/oligopeptide transport system ATP-binding protein [Evansella vedderi]|uniref:Peptide/nickel transport system ATP-binding protein/oligopeptide transport system ATP-binding protein n=1 Tax=Evansella vedderi TaxID=38282 RepID=A0ABU0A3A6_9BACI|nr:dipeptide ABC transporter ATP-binding protein [Evansella vedderi]MDQ0257972.1 peptide/nickel transport system ATP-binding protein/oligopeptide transport system ATP-binding protein [Evansella vedderi]